eukprot:gene55095-40445_t
MTADGAVGDADGATDGFWGWDVGAADGVNVGAKIGGVL